jgi:hypothetical protein
VNNRERTIAIFNHKKTDRLIWQPRLHHWYEVNKARGFLPKKYQGWDLLQIYDDLDASPRGYHYFNNTIKVIEGEKIKVELKEDGDFIYTKYITVKGNLSQIEKKNLWGTNKLCVEYFLKKKEDFEILEYILRNQDFEFDKKMFDRMDKLVGDRCEPMISILHGSIQRFFIDYMGLERGTIMIWKNMSIVDKLIQILHENDDKKFNLIKKTPYKLISLGDNIDDSFVSPKLFEKYMLPYYQHRTKQLHQVGKFCISHWDGKIKNILSFARKTGLDCLECVPPKPQGNVTLDELKLGLEGMILSDGIPATLFMPYADEPKLKDFVYRLLDLFTPNIIVGISDMMPPDGDIERIKMVGRIVGDYKI